MCFAYIKLTAEIYKQKTKIMSVLFILLKQDSPYHHISQSGDTVRKTPLYLYLYLTQPRYVLAVKPKSSPKAKSQIQITNPSPKSKIQSPEEKEWDWG